MTTIAENKLLYLGYKYNKNLKCWKCEMNNISYSVFGRKPTIKGILQQHFKNKNHSNQHTY